MRPLKKIFKILKLLSEGHKINKYDVVSLGELSLNSTISDLQKRQGFTVSRVRRKDKGGVVEYWLEESERFKALALLRKIEMENS